MREQVLYTEEQITAEVEADKAFILSQTHPEDSASEYADTALPIYYTEIIEEWKDLPSDYQNCYQELTDTLPDRVETLMSYDLYLYYHALYSGAITNLLETAEEQN